MGDFYGMKPGAIPGFADAGSGKFISVEGLPRRTVTNMAAFMEKLRRMHQEDPLAFEVCVRMSRPPSKTSAGPKASSTPETAPLDPA